MDGAVDHIYRRSPPCVSFAQLYPSSSSRATSCHRHFPLRRRRWPISAAFNEPTQLAKLGPIKHTFSVTCPRLGGEEGSASRGQIYSRDATFCLTAAMTALIGLGRLFPSCSSRRGATGQVNSIGGQRLPVSFYELSFFFSLHRFQPEGRRAQILPVYNGTAHAR